MPKTILIVDDQEDILLVLEREFRKAPGLTSISATNYAEALSLISEKQIDLVISDVRLGNESGFDLVREIKRSRPGLGFILMSAYRSTGNRQQAAELGVVMFLEKPFQISRLIKDIENYFHQLENLAPEPEPVEEPKPAASNDSIKNTNSLAHFKLQDLVQLFCLNGRNILITVTPEPNSPGGEIYIQRGRVIHAEFNVMSGDAAFHALMLLDNPILKVKDWTALVPVTIKSNWEHLLLQSAIHLDTQELPVVDSQQRRMGSSA